MRKYYLADKYYGNLHWVENGIYCELLRSGHVLIHGKSNTNGIKLIPFSFDIWKASPEYKQIALNIMKMDIIKQCIFESVKEST